MTDIVTLLAGPALLAVGALAAWGKEIVDRGHREQREDKAAERQERRDKEARFEAQAKDYRDAVGKQCSDILLIHDEQIEAIISGSTPVSTPNESADERFLRIGTEIMSRRSRFHAALIPLRLDLTSRQVLIEALKADSEVVRILRDQIEWQRKRTDLCLQAWPELGAATHALYSALSSVESAIWGVLEQYQPAFNEVRERMLQQLGQQALTDHERPKAIPPPQSSP